MSFEEKDFTGDVSYEKEIGIPMYTDRGLAAYPKIVEKIKYNSNEDIGTACAVFSQDKYRTWVFPDIEVLKAGIVDGGYFTTWSAKYKRDPRALESHLEYGMRISDKQVESLWKTKKFVSPVTVCCIALSGSSMDPVISEQVIKGITKILESSGITKKANIEVCKTITSSVNLYDQISKFEENGYKAMNTGMAINNSEYKRERQVGVDRYKFTCIPVFVQPTAMGKFNLDYFFSLNSELLAFDADKMSECVKSITGITGCLHGHLIPAEAIPEFAGLLDFKNNEDCVTRKNIRELSRYLSENYQSLFVDLHVRGSEHNVRTLDFPNNINASEMAQKIEVLLNDAVIDGGGYALFASPCSEDCVTAFGLAYDNASRWSPIPPRYLERIYHPDFTSRGFAGLKKDCVEFTDAVKIKFKAM